MGLTVTSILKHHVDFIHDCWWKPSAKERRQHAQAESHWKDAPRSCGCGRAPRVWRGNAVKRPVFHLQQVNKPSTAKTSYMYDVVASAKLPCQAASS